MGSDGGLQNSYKYYPNYGHMFYDSTYGADASMMVYSLIEISRANGLNPQKYWEYLLEARPSKNMSDEELENMAP